MSISLELLCESILHHLWTNVEQWDNAAIKLFLGYIKPWEQTIGDVNVTVF